jgi:hypothetical protein
MAAFLLQQLAYAIGCRRAYPSNCMHGRLFDSSKSSLACNYFKTVAAIDLQTENKVHFTFPVAQKRSFMRGYTLWPCPVCKSLVQFNPSIVKISSRKILRPPALVPRGRCRSDSPYPSSPSPLLSAPYSPPSAEAAGQSPCGAVGGGGALRPATSLAAELLPRVNGGASVLLFGGGVLLRAGIWCLAQPRFRPFWAHMGLGGQAASSYCGAS